MAAVNKLSITLMEDLRKDFESAATPMVISGCVGPRGDGYKPGELMSAEEAQAYHNAQIKAFAETAVDQVTAITMTNVPEAIGVTRAAQAVGLPVVISFTVETDGRLPSGETLKQAIDSVDAATGNGPVYFMINCAHPDHFVDALEAGEAWAKRIRGVRANASRLSHAELDEAIELDDGNPEEFGRQHRDLQRMMKHIVVMGGCCGTDHRHIEAICRACVSEAA
jgi:S-methylmethionine-dependent homocysteine/selenocysteine methylase